MFKFFRNKKTLFSKLIVLVMIFSSTASLGNLNVINTIDTNYKTLSTQSRSDSWIEALQANYGNSTWYGGHLNTTDRLMIREAMDYAIPRTNIINSVFNGLASSLATYAIPQQGQYYFANITAKPYDLTKSEQLLSDVFGYTYSANDNPSTPYNESIPYFPLNLMVPNTQPLRIQAANLINGVYKSLGINSTLQELPFTEIVSRAFSQTVGNDYNNGGFDGLFIGWGRNNAPDDGGQWFASYYIPNNNFEFVNNSHIDTLVYQENNASLSSKQIQAAYYQMQKYVSDQSLKYILYQNVVPYLYSKYLQGFNPYFALNGLLPYQNLSFSNAQTNLNLDMGGYWSGLNPLLQNTASSNYVIHGLWAGGLLAASTAKNSNNPFLADYYDNLASSYTVSSNGLFYNFTLRHGIGWADGTNLTANDVAFTYKSIMTLNIGSTYYGAIAYDMNNNSIHVYDNYHIGFQLLHPLLPSSNAKSLFAVTILPNATYNTTSSWSNAPTNTGTNLNASMYNSNGPYQISSVNTYTGEVDLTVNPLWQNVTYANQFAVPGFNVTPTINTIKIIENVGQNIAISNVESGVSDFMDPTTYLNISTVYSSNIEPSIASGSISGYNSTSYDYEELSLNQNSTIWGFSPNGAYTINPVSTSTSSNPVTTSSKASTISAPFGDFTSILLAFVVISAFSVIRKRRKFK